MAATVPDLAPGGFPSPSDDFPSPSDTTALGSKSDEPRPPSDQSQPTIRPDGADDVLSDHASMPANPSLSTGHARIDKFLDDSIANVRRHATSLDAATQVTIWKEMAPPPTALPRLTDATHYIAFDAALVRWVNSSNSACAFLPSPRAALDEGVADSLIFELRHRFWANAIRNATPPDAAKDELTEAHDLLQWVMQRYGQTPSSAVLGIARGLKDLRKFPTETPSAFWTKVSNLHAQAVDAAAGDYEKFFSDLFKANAKIALGPTAASVADWLGPKDDTPFAAAIAAAAAADAHSAALQVTTPRPRCGYCRRPGHAEDECRKKQAEKDNKSKDKPKDKGKESGVHRVEAADSPDDNETPSPCPELFLCDSGSPFHIVRDHMLFKDLRPAPAVTPTGPSGEPISVIGVGDLQLHQPSGGRTLYLRNALCAPSVSTNIVSTRALEHEQHTITWGSDSLPILIDYHGLPAANFYRTPTGYYGKFLVEPGLPAARRRQAPIPTAPCRWLPSAKAKFHPRSGIVALCISTIDTSSSLSATISLSRTSLSARLAFRPSLPAPPGRPHNALPLRSTASSSTLGGARRPYPKAAPPASASSTRASTCLPPTTTRDTAG